MFRSCQMYLLVLLLLLGGCFTKGESELSKALSGAVREKKLSQKMMDNMLGEYNKLVDDDKVKAREYVKQVLNAIEMGADSSHIDVIRHQVVGNRGV